MGDPRRVVIIAGRHRPHEILLLGVSVLTGASYLLGAPPPGSVSALIPRWEFHLWAAGLLASGVTGLVGCLWRWDLRFGLGVELGGMLIGAGALLVYVTALFQLGAVRALLAGGTVVAWMGANLWRAWQISRDLKGM